jgi:hypothetical protein
MSPTSEMEKFEALGFLGLELREFRIHTSIYMNLQKAKKRKMD